MGTLTFETPDRGMSTRPDFLRLKGFLREAKNCRSVPGTGCVSRNGSDLIDNISELDPDLEYRYADIGDHLIAIGDLEDVTDGNLLIQAFNGQGAPITIYRQATLAFEDGLVEPEIGDEVEGASSGATGVITGITLDSGEWGTTDPASGTFTIRHTSPGVDWEAGEDIEIIGVSPVTAASVLGDTGTTQIEVSNDYLGDDISAIRLYAIEDSVYIYNTQVEVATLPAPTGVVTKELIDYDKLINRDNTIAGQIYKTTLTSQGNPAGYYLCVSGSGTGNPPDPPGQYRRIPKPDQADALYDPSTMPHRLLRISETVYEWQQLAWDPRLSGGDVDGTDAQGNPVIRNPPVLKDNRILALTFAHASMVLLLSNKKVLVSVRRDYYDLWLDDVLELKPTDRIVDELLEANSGEFLYAEPAGGGVFIQCEAMQAQYATRGGAALSAGGPDGPYNGDLRGISEFKPNPDVAPVSWGNYVAMVDAQKTVHVYGWRGNQEDYNFAPIGEPSLIIHDDFIQQSPLLMRAINSHLYIVMDDGRAWLGQVQGTERDGSLRVAWAYTQFDEPIQYLWGYQEHIRFLTTYGAGMSLLQHIDQEVVPDSQFDIPPRLDRMEEIEGVYTASVNETAFTMKTTPDLDETRMFLLHDIVRVNFIGGVEEFGVGDTLVGAASGAQGVIFRIVSSGQWGRTALIGGHGIGLNATVSNQVGVEVARQIVPALKLASVDEGLSESKFQQFNDASGGPIDLAYTIRWVDAIDDFYDDPPEIDSALYLAVRSTLVNILNQPQAQISILRGNFYLGIGGNEGFGGPGTTPSYEKLNRMLAIADDLIVHLRANVTNGDKIWFASSALTASAVVHPDFVVEGEVSLFLQAGKRRWIQWVKDHYDQNAVLDLHILISGIDTGEKPMTPQLEAAFAYAETIDLDLTDRWISTEFAPVFYQPREDLEGATSLMTAMFNVGYSYGARLLCYGVIFENFDSGDTFVWCSILVNNPLAAKEPFASVLTDLLAVPTADNARYGRVFMRRVGTTAFEENEALLLGDVRAAAANGAEVDLGRRGDLRVPTRVDGSVAVFEGQYGPLTGDSGSVDIKHLLGRLVQARAVLPTQWAGMSKDRVMISSMSSFHDRTTDYEVVRTRIGYDAEVRHQFTAKRLGQMKHGETPIESGHFEMLAGADGRTMQIAIESNTPGRFRFSGMEFEAERVVI